MEGYFISLFVIFCIVSFGHQIKAINECSSSPCMNGATCVDGNYGYYTCQCTTNWMGTNCEIAVEGVNCGTNHYSSSGIVTSPNYPNSYNINAHCSYFIRVHGATRIELNFTSFETEFYFDGLLIGTGPIPRISKPMLTGSPTHLTYTFNTNEIWMEFISDEAVSKSGWSCIYSADFSDCPCLNGGSCIDDLTKQCDCVAGWEGERCESDINECTSMPCLNEGYCIDKINHYSCTCASGWYGTHCESDVNECDSMLCLNGGTCTNYDGYYECNCVSGWYGSSCQHENTKCVTNPCHNGGTCFEQVDNKYYCRCQPGYSGSTCKSVQCLRNLCLNGGTCHVGYYHYYEFTCECQSGFSGVTCDTDINECSSQPCLNGGTCIDDINLYTCDCLPGWRGDNCEIDINECSSHPCLNGGTLNDDINLYTCDCLSGWRGDNCEIDINECSSQPCLNNGTCNDDINLYTCDCLPGWRGDNCEIDINECSSQPCLNGGTCNNDINLYTCNCLQGWTGVNCQIESSTDDVTDNLVAIILGAVNVILLIVVAFILYKYYHLKNAEKGHDTKVQYSVPKETLTITTTHTYENRLPVVEVHSSSELQTDNDGYDVLHPYESVGPL